MLSWTIFVVFSALATLVAALLPGTSPDSICELSVCSCLQGKLHCRCDQRIQNLVIRAGGHDSLPLNLGSITVENCMRVHVMTKSVEKLQPLRSFNIYNVGHLELENEAFSWNTTKVQETYLYPGIDIRINNVTINTIPTDAFKGHLNIVSFEKVKIGNIKALAFSNIASMERIEFIDSFIDTVEPQAFKKFILESFIIKGGRIKYLPSYSLIGIVVKKELKFADVNFEYVRSNAIRIEEPRVFRIQNCRIAKLEGDAFQVTTRGPVFIDDNIFLNVDYAAFLSITLDSRYQATAGRQEMIFENNTFENFGNYALYFNNSGLKPKIDRLVIKKPCSCLDASTWTRKLVKFSEGSPPGLERLMWCMGKEADIVISDYERKHCLSNSPQVYWIVSVLIIVLLALIALCSIGFWLFRRHTKRYINVPQCENNRLSVHSGHNVIIIPDGKTYRETELHIIEERVEPIKEYIPTQNLAQSK